MTGWNGYRNQRFSRPGNVYARSGPATNSVNVFNQDQDRPKESYPVPV